MNPKQEISEDEFEAASERPVGNGGTLSETAHTA